MSDSVRVRPATGDELPAVRNVLDGAALQIEHERLPAAVETGGVLVAVVDGRVLGALVLDGTEITAIAVRRRRRGQGIGTALVDAAAARCEALSATCDRRVAPFWRAAGFELTVLDSTDRVRGYRER